MSYPSIIDDIPFSNMPMSKINKILELEIQIFRKLVPKIRGVEYASEERNVLNIVREAEHEIKPFLDEIVALLTKHSRSQITKKSIMEMIVRIFREVSERPRPRRRSRSGDYRTRAEPTASDRLGLDIGGIVVVESEQLSADIEELDSLLKTKSGKLKLYYTEATDLAPLLSRPPEVERIRKVKEAVAEFTLGDLYKKDLYSEAQGKKDQRSKEIRSSGELIDNSRTQKKNV